ncbi:MAG: hypothetical protein REJ50_21730 [Bordetella sp.]|nr:hypothetical protein [Bordetella sp.]
MISTPPLDPTRAPDGVIPHAACERRRALECGRGIGIEKSEVPATNGSAREGLPLGFTQITATRNKKRSQTAFLPKHENAV